MTSFSYFLGIILICCFFLTSCHSTKKTTKSDTTYKKVSGENFDKFYKKFHKDSEFQISRIKFPLSGMLIDGPTKSKWTKNNLPLFKVMVYDVDQTQYKVLYKKTDTTFTQKVWTENSGFLFECRFELIDKKWYLVHVLDQNL